MRKAAESDIPRLLAIEHATQISPWSEDIFQRCLSSGCDCWVVEEAGQIIAFIMLSSSITQESHILNLCVDPNYQRKGYAENLLKFAISKAKSQAMGIAYLEVRRSNHKAINLYHKLGFVQIGERKNYYPAEKGKEDALIFARDLSV
ncbi:MAG TPA: ribosomal protein S18-alanine N-acetyltransferase [Gammaproteobacteria bacterium]|nr:ribosomal protein S18-alanine N-acetyltransferase [Gammaproteobacteria bacterium]